MRSATHLHRTLKVGLIACAFLVASGAKAPPPPPPPPPIPPIGLAQAVLRDAAAYQAYMAQASAISANFTSGVQVAASLKTGESYDPQQLLRGEIAYAAVVALQDPDFVAAVRGYAADQTSRLQIRDALYHDPAYVLTIKGSDGAAGLVTAALMDQADTLAKASAAIKQSAFDVQHQAWSKEFVVDRAGRLADAEASSRNPIAGSPDDVARLQQATEGTAPLMVLAPPTPPPYTPAIVRGLALAALGALGEAGEDNASYVAGFQVDPATSDCMNSAKLNLYQCLAVAKPHYEDIFCLGQHAMGDTAQCLAIAAGAPPPLIAPAIIPKPAPAPVHHAKPKRRAK